MAVPKFRHWTRCASLLRWGAEWQARLADQPDFDLPQQSALVAACSQRAGKACLGLLKSSCLNKNMLHDRPHFCVMQYILHFD